MTEIAEQLIKEIREQHALVLALMDKARKQSES